ncbi:hypothetical protein [Cerasicoccus frondis]|uniref:hypothetical protein n=1 Tax=Cerasicoccus frondis TaxID=490090 RepID=UPI0028526964|nr:hypothetical protein [Cerasicoccus frondis]
MNTVKEPIPTREDNPDGYHQKYIISKADGSPVDPGAEYFVLRLTSGGDQDHHKASLRALSAYVDSIEGKLPKLASDLRERYSLLSAFALAWISLSMDAYKTAYNNGFYEHNGTHPSDGDIGIWIMNIVSELAEAWQGHRDNMKDTHLPDRDALEVELADVILRTMSTAEALGFKLESAILEKHAYNKTRPYRHGGKRF